MRSCLHLPFYHVQLGEEKVTTFFISQIDHEESQPPPLNFGLFSYPFSMYCTLYLITTMISVS